MEIHYNNHIFHHISTPSYFINKFSVKKKIWNSVQDRAKKAKMYAWYITVFI